MGLLVLFLGLAFLLVVIVRRAAGIALVGCTLTLLVGLAVVIWASDTPLPEAVGFLFIVMGIALLAAIPPAEEQEQPMGDSIRPAEEHPLEPAAPGTLTRAADTGANLNLVDHTWLAGLPLLGFAVAFLALPARTGLMEGVWWSLMTGMPEVGFAFGVTDVSALFGMLLIFPGHHGVLCVPLTGLICLLVLLARGRPTAFTAAVEYGLITVGINLVTLLFFPVKP